MGMESNVTKQMKRPDDLESLAGRFFALNPEQRRLIHILLCEHALEKWRVYINVHGPTEYVETAAGTRQEVDSQLPFDALVSARQGLDTRNINQRYLEPIAALQDGDLVFPEPITFAYYVIYNLFKKYVNKENIDDWLIVNQSLSAEDNANVWNKLLSDAIQRIKL